MAHNFQPQWNMHVKVVYQKYQNALNQPGRPIPAGANHMGPRPGRLIVTHMMTNPNGTISPLNQPKNTEEKPMPTKAHYTEGDMVTYGGVHGFVVLGGVLSSDGHWWYELQHPATRMNVRAQDTELPPPPTGKDAPVKKAKAEVTFESVIISDDKRQQIIEAIEQVKKQALIFDTWGFSETIEKGRGVSMLFYGEPGTGKTLMAQAIAHKLGKKLAIINTADIESSAPGQAERNIRQHFASAKKEGKILLFDECDSMIFTRTGVGPIVAARINELLSQIERFDGITMFTTNRLGTLDEAVNRRLALKLSFDMPTKEEREQIWQRMFPKQAPLDKDVDFAKLATVEMTGGYIKNAVLRAARMAAVQKGVNARKKIKMEHLVKAVTLEAESMVEFREAAKGANNV